MKKLPLKVDAMIMSECWTYYKMAIIETSPYKYPWLASHFRAFSYHDLSVMLGENGHMHPLQYFEDILSIQEIPIGTVNNGSLIETLTGEISQGNYLVIECNFPKLFSDDPECFHIHEVFLFGFDEEKQVFYSTLLQSSGRFQEAEIPFARLREAFSDISCFYGDHPEIMSEHRCFYYSISRIRLREQYNNDNSLYLLLEKIQDELRGSMHRTLIYDKNGQLPDASSLIYSKEGKVSVTGEYFTGLACLLMMREDIKRLLEMDTIPQELMERTTSSLMKLHEHQSIIHLSLKWFLDEISTDNPQLRALVEWYGNCCGNMNMMYLMALKFEMTQKRELLERIQEKLLALYKEEHDCLTQFETIARKEYYECLRRQLKS